MPTAEKKMRQVLRENGNLVPEPHPDLDFLDQLARKFMIGRSSAQAMLGACLVEGQRFRMEAATLRDRPLRP